LPGGYGTLEEFCEVVTWAQLGLHRKPCGLLNVAGFYDPLLAQLDYQVTEGFLRPATRSLVIESGDPERLLMAFSRYRASVTEQSIGLDQT
ncbi:MAG: LOG family protein, partial [Nitrospirota bacterium]|nr:LOG family protein [Nitrospirota bacterium]